MILLELTNTDEFWRVVFEPEGLTEMVELCEMVGAQTTPDMRCLLILESSPGGWIEPPDSDVNPLQEELSL